MRMRSLILSTATRYVLPLLLTFPTSFPNWSLGTRLGVKGESV